MDSGHHISPLSIKSNFLGLNSHRLKLTGLCCKLTPAGNLSCCLLLLQWMTASPLPSCLLAVGRQEEQEAAQDLAQASLNVLSAADSMYSFLAEDSKQVLPRLLLLLLLLPPQEQELRQVLEQLARQEPVLKQANKPNTPLFYSLHSVSLAPTPGQY